LTPAAELSKTPVNLLGLKAKTGMDNMKNTWIKAMHPV
jgi:hypothetical protein